MTFDKNYSIPKNELYPTDCLEHIKTIKLETLSKEDLNFNKTFKSLITIGNLSKTPEGNLKFEFVDSKFDNCGSLNPTLRLRCKSESGTLTNITIEGLKIYSENITGLQCWAMGYINSSNVEDTFSRRKWSKCFTASGADCDNVKSQDLFIGLSVGGSLLMLASVGVLSGFLILRRREVVVHTIRTDLSPSHIVIKKTKDIKEDLDLAASLQVRDYHFFSYSFLPLVSTLSRINMRRNLRNLRVSFKTTSTPKKQH